MIKIVMVNFKFVMFVFKSYVYLKELEKILKLQYFDRVFVFFDFLGLLFNLFLYFILGV